MLASQKPKGTGVATVYLAVAEPQKGDAENRQLEIVFPGPLGDAAGAPERAALALLRQRGEAGRRRTPTTTS